MNENWFLLGDVHGETAPIEYFYNQNSERLKLNESKNYIILLGDVECNFSINSRRDLNFKKNISKLPFTYICLRGNHESRVKDVMDKFPDRWMQIHMYGGVISVEKEFPFIHYLSDGPALYEFMGYITLAIPGAYSPDKEVRLRNNWTWFENEKLTKEEMDYGRELVKKQKKVDLVISHTCPIAFEPRDLFLTSVTRSLEDKSMEFYLGEIEESLNYHRWAWGHFHADRLYPWDGKKEKLMLFNEKVVNVEKFMEMGKNDSLIDILA